MIQISISDCGYWFIENFYKYFFEIVIWNGDSRNACDTLSMFLSYVMLWAIWYYLYNLKIEKNTHGGELLLVKLQVFSLQLPQLY